MVRVGHARRIFDVRMREPRLKFSHLCQFITCKIGQVSRVYNMTLSSRSTKGCTIHRVNSKRLVYKIVCDTHRIV